MSTIHRITPDCQPVFPCWLWGRINAIYPSPVEHWRPHSFMPNAGLHYLPGRPDDKLRPGVFLATHWHPDQPEAPTVTPDAPTYNTCIRQTSEGMTRNGVLIAPTTAPTPAETAPLAAPAQGETPRTDAVRWFQESTVPNGVAEVVPADTARRLERELNEAKTLYAASLDTLKDMSAQVAQLTGAQDRMDAEIAMLTADLFRATSERDQARQDLEERCAENDRERAAHLQAYQEACKERDAAIANHIAAQSRLTTAESELAELRRSLKSEQEMAKKYHEFFIATMEAVGMKGAVGGVYGLQRQVVERIVQLANHNKQMLDAALHQQREGKP